MHSDSNPPPRRRLVLWLGFAEWLAIVLAAAGAAGIASRNARESYLRLDRPVWAPPGWLFAPVWTVLYIAMAVAAWLVWRKGGFRSARAALSLFVVQLAFNALWTWLFFVWRQGALAFVEIVVLWLLIGATVAAFWRVQRVAAALLLPYWAWVTFATALTFSTWERNPQWLG